MTPRTDRCRRDPRDSSATKTIWASRVRYLVIASAAWIDGSRRPRRWRRGARRSVRGPGRRRADRAAHDVLGHGVLWTDSCDRGLTDLEPPGRPLAIDPIERAQVLFTLSGLYAMRDRDDGGAGAYRTLSGDAGRPRSAAVLPVASAEIGGVSELIIGDPDAAERWLADGISRLEGLGAIGYLATLACHPVGRTRALRPVRARPSRSPRGPRPRARRRTLSSSSPRDRSSDALLGLGDVARSIRTQRESRSTGRDDRLGQLSRRRPHGAGGCAPGERRRARCCGRRNLRARDVPGQGAPPGRTSLSGVPRAPSLPRSRHLRARGVPA